MLLHCLYWTCICMSAPRHVRLIGCTIWVLRATQCVNVRSTSTILDYLIGNSLDLLQRRQVVVITKTLIVQPSLIILRIRPANCGGSSRLEPDVRRSVEETRNQISSYLPANTTSQLCHARLHWVHLHRLLGQHARSHRIVAKRKRFLDAIRVCGPTTLQRRQKVN